jgi:thiol-disulfide isomerase/thioredoxin
MLPLRFTAVVLIAALSAVTQAKDLKVGDAAPEVRVDQWIQSETTVGEGKPYIVEFWATWCGPCKVAIPHMNDLYNKYKGDGLKVIGVSNEKQEIGKVKDFVRQQGSQMSYSVAIDGGVWNDWLEAAGQKGIPCAFIVDDTNHIAFIGHPMDDQFEDILGKVMDGRYNPKLEKQAKPMLAAADSAARVKNWSDVYRHLDAVIELDPRVFLAVSLRKYRTLVCEEQNAEGATAWAAEMLTTYASDAGALEAIAEMAAADSEACVLNMELARTAADAMLALEGRLDPDALATSAMVAFRAGDKDRAIREQQQAYLAVSPERKEIFKRNLELYSGKGRKRGR